MKPTVARDTVHLEAMSALQRPSLIGIQDPKHNVHPLHQLSKDVFALNRICDYPSASLESVPGIVLAFFVQRTYDTLQAIMKPTSLRLTKPVSGLINIIEINAWRGHASIVS